MAIICICLFVIAIVPKELQNDTFYTIKLGELILNNGIDGKRLSEKRALEILSNNLKLMKSMKNIIAFGCEFQGEQNNIHDANEHLEIDSLKNKKVEIKSTQAQAWGGSFFSRRKYTRYELSFVTEGFCNTHLNVKILMHSSNDKFNVTDAEKIINLLNLIEKKKSQNFAENLNSDKNLSLL